MLQPVLHTHLMQTHSRLPLRITRGEGAYLYDEDQRPYLDFASGVAVTALGHCHPALVEAAQEQLHTLWHCGNGVVNPLQESLAERLASLTFADQVFFCSSGLEAVEAAIKLVRKYHYDRGAPERTDIITLERGFHGRSMACISAGGNAIAREGFGPLLEGFETVSPNDLSALKAAITPKTAAILLEPVQAEGGVHLLDIDYLKAVRELATQHGILLCFDEVQCGYGRTAQLFRYQQIDVVPDLLTCAKGIGSGFPLAALLATAEIASAFTPGTHGSTYGGNPLAMRIGHAVLDVMLAEGFFKRVEAVSAYALEQLRWLQQTYPHYITDIRGAGLLIGVELNGPTGIAGRIVQEAAHQGLLITRAAGGRVLRLVPPLIITRKEVDEALAILTTVLKEL